MSKSKIKLTKGLNVEISTLKPFEKNPNRHTDFQIDELAKSLAKYGQYKPIRIDEKNTILGGHGTIEAMKKLGWTHAECVRIEGLTKKEKIKVVLEDNKIQSLSVINMPMQEELIKEIGDTDIIGFNMTYLDGIVNDTSIDNMGINYDAGSVEEMLSGKMNHQPTQQAAQEPAQQAQPAQPIGTAKVDSETAQTQQNAFENAFGEENMAYTRKVVCPHCGQEFQI